MKQSSHRSNVALPARTTFNPLTHLRNRNLHLGHHVTSSLFRQKQNLKQCLRDSANTFVDYISNKEKRRIIKVKVKVCSFIARYPVHRTAQSALHFTPWQTCSFQGHLNFFGNYTIYNIITTCTIQREFQCPCK